MAELLDVLASAIEKAARTVHRQYKLISVEDLEQHIRMEVLSDGGRFAELARKPGKDLSAALKTVGFRLVKEDERYRRAARAAAAGYRPEDECFYSIGQLRNLIPPYLDNGVTESPPVGRETRQDGNCDPATGKTWLATMVDLDEAFKALKQHHADILRRYFQYPQGRGGWTHLEIAGHLGIEPESLRGRINRALKALQRRLGGLDPWDKRGATSASGQYAHRPVPPEQNRGGDFFEPDPATSPRSGGWSYPEDEDFHGYVCGACGMEDHLNCESGDCRCCGDDPVSALLQGEMVSNDINPRYVCPRCRRLNKVGAACACGWGDFSDQEGGAS